MILKTLKLNSKQLWKTHGHNPATQIDLVLFGGYHHIIFTPSLGLKKVCEKCLLEGQTDIPIEQNVDGEEFYMCACMAPLLLETFQGTDFTGYDLMSSGLFTL